MPKITEKIRRALAARQAAVPSAKGYRIPGSMNRHKTGLKSK